MNFQGPNFKNFISQPIDTCPDFTNTVESWPINSLGNTLNTWKRVFSNHLLDILWRYSKSYLNLTSP